MREILWSNGSGYFNGENEEQEAIIYGRGHFTAGRRRRRGFSVSERAGLICLVEDPRSEFYELHP